MDRNYKSEIIAVLRESNEPLRPNMIVVAVAKKNTALSLESAHLVRDTVDSMIMRGELIYNNTYSGLKIPPTR